jgi:hypothetical protein
MRRVFVDHVTASLTGAQSTVVVADVATDTYTDGRLLYRVAVRAASRLLPVVRVPIVPAAVSAVPLPPLVGLAADLSPRMAIAAMLACCMVGVPFAPLPEGVAVPAHDRERLVLIVTDTLMGPVWADASHERGDEAVVPPRETFQDEIMCVAHMCYWRHPHNHACTHTTTRAHTHTHTHTLSLSLSLSLYLSLPLSFSLSFPLFFS